MIDESFTASTPADVAAGDDRGPHRLRVAFVCMEDGDRSLMAEAFARVIGGEGTEVHSAGGRPGGRVNERAVDSMRRVGYDLSSQPSNDVAALEGIELDALVTMGCGEAIPSLRARRRMEWRIPDLRDLDAAEFDRVRDLIGQKVKALFAELRGREM